MYTILFVLSKSFVLDGHSVWPVIYHFGQEQDVLAATDQIAINGYNQMVMRWIFIVPPENDS